MDEPITGRPRDELIEIIEIELTRCWGELFAGVRELEPHQARYISACIAERVLGL